MAQGSGQLSQFGIADETYTNEVQSFDLSTGAPPTGGTFTLTFDGATTAAIAYNAAAAAVQAALEALPNIGAGGVVCAGGPLPATQVTVTFSGAQVQGRNVAALTANLAGLTGGTPVFDWSTTTPGVGYGDYVAPTRFYEFKSEGIQEQKLHMRSAGIRSAARGARSDRRVTVTRGAAGPVTFDVLNKGFSKLLKHCVGKAAVITTPGGGSLSRDHTFTPGDFCDISFTAQKGVPRQQCASGNVDPFSATGCLIPEFTVTSDVDGLLELAIGVDAQQLITSQALAAVSYPASTKLWAFSQMNLTVDGANAPITNFSFQHASGLKLDRYRQRNSPLKRRPIPEGLLGVSGSIEMDYDGHARAVYDKFTAGTPGALVALWRGDLIEGALFFEFEITVPAVVFTGETPTIGSPEVVMQPLPWEAEEDGTNPLFTIRYRTTDTSD